jgi:hypothetical protein
MMAAPSVAQESGESRRICYMVNLRYHTILSMMAEKRGMSVEKMMLEEAVHLALEHRSLLPLTMPPEHYEARRTDDDTFYE